MKVKGKYCIRGFTDLDQKRGSDWVGSQEYETLEEATKAAERHALKESFLTFVVYGALRTVRVTTPPIAIEEVE